MLKIGKKLLTEMLISLGSWLNYAHIGVLCSYYKWWCSCILTDIEECQCIALS